MVEKLRPPITRITRGEGYNPDAVDLGDGTRLIIFGSRGQAELIRFALNRFSEAEFTKNTALKVNDSLTIGVRLIDLKSP